MVAAGQGLGAGDRILHLGLGRQKQADVLVVRRDLTAIRFDDGSAVWTLTTSCHPVPRRPPPEW